MELKAMETLEFSLLESNQTHSIGNNTTDVGQLLINMFGPKRKDFVSAITLTIVYSVIFLSGMVGNICTCLVIVRTNSMQTTTNYYLFSLAVSDLLLIFFGLPPEQYAIWEAYPWRLGEAFCYLRQTVLETTSYASVLTITAFTVERYLAICHPLLAHKIATLSRAVKIILSIWVVSVCVALPYAVHTRTYYAVNLPGTMVPVPDSLVCNIPIDHFQSGFMYYMFQVSTFLFFIGPVTLIIILYILIGIALRRSPLSRGASDERSYSSMHTSTSLPNQPRKVVVRMLVAVTVAFIVCWAPFHTQRLMILYVKTWTPQMLAIQSHIFYTSGVLYFVSSTLNPILYNVISKRYRAAFKQIIFPCCKTRPSQSFNSVARQSDRFSKSQAMVVLKNGNESLRVVFRQEPSDTAVSLEALELNGTAQCAAVDDPSNNFSSSSGSVEMPSSPVCLQPGNHCQKYAGGQKPCLKKDSLLDKYVITNKGVNDMLLLSKDTKVKAAIKKAERPRKSYAHQVNGRVSLKMAGATNGADTTTYESETTRGSVVR